MLSLLHDDVSWHSRTARTSVCQKNLFFLFFDAIDDIFSVVTEKNCQLTFLRQNWSSYHLHFIGFLQILRDISFRSNNKFNGATLELNSCVRWQSNIIWLELRKAATKSTRVEENLEKFHNLNLQSRNICVRVKLKTKFHLFKWKWNKVNLSNLFNSQPNHSHITLFIHCVFCMRWYTKIRKNLSQFVTLEKIL